LQPIAFQALTTCMLYTQVAARNASCRVVAGRLIVSGAIARDTDVCIR
jgi:hypothetical protein